MKINKKYILVILLFVFIICLSYLNKPKVLLSEVKLIDENKNVKSYAIMISNDGTNYSESESNMIPTYGYKLNTTMSYCVTLTGDTLHGVISEISFGSVKVDVANTVNCYLYYEPDDNALATVIEESDYSLYTTEANMEAGTFYRYSGDENGKRNVIYADTCWQIFRTTKNGSIKMIYNGEPAYDSTLGRYTCGRRTSIDHKGYEGNISVLGASSGTTYNYYYGTGYYFDETSSSYKLSGEVGPYNYYNDYNTVIGMYTCKNTTANAICSNIYYVDAYQSETSARVIKRINIETYYDRIGTVSFNLSPSPAYVGYMYNSHYDVINASQPSSSNPIMYGYSFEERTVQEQEDGKGKYKLVGNNNLTNSLQSVTYYGTNTLNNSHYTCLNGDGICDTLYFAVSYQLTGAFKIYLVTLPDGKTIQSAIDEMLNNSDINVNSSAIKGLIDFWYKEHILNKEDTNHNQLSSYLDTDEIFCNNRSTINDYGGWSQTGAVTNKGANGLNFAGFKSNTDTDIYVSCVDSSGNERIVDEFSVTAGNHDLTYPVGLPSFPEMYILTLSIYQSDVRWEAGEYWLSSPSTFIDGAASNKRVTSGALSGSLKVNQSTGVRPSLSLNRNVIFSSGDGTTTNPWIASLE